MRILLYCMPMSTYELEPPISTLSGIGTVVRSEHLPIYQQVAEFLTRISLSFPQDPHLDKGLMRLAVDGVQDNDIFWQMASEEIAKLSSQAPSGIEE